MAEVKSMEERDWKWLPDVALASTLSYVVNPQDYVRFSLVCKPWHSVAKDQCRNFTADRQVPLLLLPPKEDSSCGQWSVYSVTEKRLLDFKLKVPYREKYCYQSSRGWLVFSELDVDDRIIKLFNPFTQTEISLPPMNGIGDHPWVCINTVSLSADPSVHPNDYIVAACVHSGTRGGLALIRPGRLCDEWTYFIGEYGERVTGDIIFCMNRKWVYVAGHRGMVVRANVDAPAEQATLEIVVQPWNKFTKYDIFVKTTLNKYLLITKWGGKGMKVYKLEDSRFVEVDDLNGDAVFTGYTGSIALPARDFCRIKPNCIYSLPLSNFIWEFNLKDKTLSRFGNLPPHGELKFSKCWITPTINL